MRKLGIALFFVCVLTAACNLATEAQLTTSSPTIMPTPLQTEVRVPIATRTPGGSGFNTQIPLTSRANAPGGSAASDMLGNCQIFITYSGADPNNVLSMRAEPSSDSTQVVRVPNNAQVFMLPGTREVSAEGYHWLNVMYIDAAQNRYEGWIARDSFMTNGVRDPSIATLRHTGQSGSC